MSFFSCNPPLFQIQNKYRILFNIKQDKKFKKDRFGFMNIHINILCFFQRGIDEGEKPMPQSSGRHMLIAAQILALRHKNFIDSHIFIRFGFLGESSICHLNYN
jgi:hypothetical protein